MSGASSPDSARFYDVVVVGGGPAGLTAALYLARARYRVLVVEKDHFGGQITITSEVVNYPGVFKTSGKELTETMRAQAQAFGAEFLLAEVESLDMSADLKIVRTSRGDYTCFGVLLATGAHPRKVGFKGEEEFRGRGVAYCATCDGEFFTGKDVFVIGGGFSAAEESVFLTKFARKVTILMRGSDFSCAESVAEEARTHEKITVLPNSVVEEVAGDDGLNSIRWVNKISGEVTEFRSAEGESFGVFVFAGYTPATALVRGLAALDEQGYVITGRDQKTSIEGLYAAGDVCIKPLRQVVTAVSDGALAAAELEHWVASQQRKTGQKAVLPERRKAGHDDSSVSEQNSAEAGRERSTTSDSLFTSEMKTQLDAVFGRMERPLILRLSLDERPVSRDLEGYMRELAGLTDKLSLEFDVSGTETDAPCVRICHADGTDTGLAFHGVPGGHEFTSFVLGLYNASGPGQSLDADIAQAISHLDRPVDLKVLVSLSCTMCPELVTAAQRIAAASPLVRAEVYDLNHFEVWKERFNVMSVPCLVLNDSKVSFGRKNIRQVLEFISGA